MKAAIDNITAAIVRPPRARYTKLDLGPTRYYLVIFDLCFFSHLIFSIRNRGVEYCREDFEVYNDRGIQIRGSLWALAYPDKDQAERCIIYLHPNSGSRIDVVRTRVISIAAQARCNVCGFDFAGCGDSGGEFVSLGVNEKEDLCAILVHLQQRGCKRFLLWGRSMGAATAAMFYGAYRDLAGSLIIGMILDSPFTSFQGLALDYSTGKVQIPRILLTPAVHILRRTVRKRCDFDIFQVNPLAAAPMCRAPCIVLSGDTDKIVSPTLSEELYMSLGGPKIRVLFEGGHNSQRPSEIYDAIRELAIALFQRVPVREVLRRATAPLAPKARTTRARSEDESEMTSRTVIDDLTAENDAYQLAADAEAALKNLLREKDMHKLTEEDVSAALADINSKRLSNNDSKRLSSAAKGLPSPTIGGFKPDINAMKTFVNSSVAEAKKKDLDAKSARYGPQNSSRKSGSDDDRSVRRVGSMREASGSKAPQKSKVVTVRSYTFELGPEAEKRDEDPEPDSDLSSPGYGVGQGVRDATGSSAKTSPADMKSDSKDGTASQRGSHGLYRRLHKRDTAASSSTSGGGTNHSLSAPLVQSVNWLNSLFFSSAAPLSAEDKADREMCPRVPSSWAALATAITVSAMTDIVCDQIVEILMSIAVGLEQRAIDMDVSALTPEHRSLLLSMLATTAMADLGLPSVHQEDSLSWGRLLGDGLLMRSNEHKQIAADCHSGFDTSLAPIRECDQTEEISGTRRIASPDTSIREYATGVNATQRRQRGVNANLEWNSDRAAPSEEKELAPPSEESELAAPSEESVLAPDASPSAMTTLTMAFGQGPSVRVSTQDIRTGMNE